MDYEKICERNYRMVELVRQRNTREFQRLEDHLYGKHGMVAIHKSKLDEMDKHKDMLRKELDFIKKTVCTTWGELPPREGDQQKNVVSNSKRKKEARKKLGNMASRKKRKTDGGLSRGTSILSGVSSVFSQGSNIRNQDSESVSSVREGSEYDMSNEDYTMASHAKEDNRSISNGISRDNIDKAKSNIKKRLLQSKHREQGLKREPSKLFPRVLSPLQEKPATSQQNAQNKDSKDSQHDGSSVHTGDMTKTNGKPTRNPSLKEGQPKMTKQPSRASLKEKPSREPSRAEITSTTQKKKPRGSNSSSKMGGEKDAKFDSLKYNPDGSLRTVHTLPDFMHSLHEAMRARYVRFNTKQWYEECFSNEQIFDRNIKEKPLVLFKNRVEKARV